MSENVKRVEQSNQYLTKPSSLNCSPHSQSPRMRTDSFQAISGQTFPHITISWLSIVPKVGALAALEPSK